MNRHDQNAIFGNVGRSVKWENSGDSIPAYRLEWKMRIIYFRNIFGSLSLLEWSVHDKNKNKIKKTTKRRRTK